MLEYFCCESFLISFVSLCLYETYALLEHTTVSGEINDNKVVMLYNIQLNV